jgi:hypothetical protein
LRSIYEIRILHMHKALIHVGYQHHWHHYISQV